MAKVGVVGLGNMGRGMALTRKRNGFLVIGFDVVSAEQPAIGFD